MSKLTVIVIVKYGQFQWYINLMGILIKNLINFIIYWKFLIKIDFVNLLKWLV